ncbi:MAG: murein biosynthesis integral membrane protein MurJ [Burkholderiaceae bacterium]
MNLLRSAATVSGLTLLSRVAGLVRETLIATIFGAGPLTDAFFVAQRLPNMLRRMFAEGAFSQAFVPLLAKTRARADKSGSLEEAQLLVNRVATALFWAVLVITVLGIVFAPQIVTVVASGLTKDPETFDSAVWMTRLMFPYILLVSLVALSAGILNTWQNFAIPAITPVLLNLSMIGAALFLADWFDPPIYALAFGVLLGGILQLALQIPALAKTGMLPKLSLNVRAAYADPATRKILKLMAPAILAVSAAQISLLINTHIASRLAPGSVSWISFGDRLMEFPNGLLGVAIGTVLLPSLSAATSSENPHAFSILLDWGLRLALLLAAPCALALALMAEPLTSMIYHYGQFDARDVAMTALAVQGYAAGLIALIGIKVLAPGFFAQQNVATPVKISVATILVTQACNLVFVPQFAHAGLPLAISVGAWVNAATLLILLLHSGRFQPRPGWLRFLLQIGLGLIVLAGLLWWWIPQYDWVAMGDTPFNRVGMVVATVVAGAGVYAGALLLVGVRPADFSRRPETAGT